MDSLGGCLDVERARPLVEALLLSYLIEPRSCCGTRVEGLGALVPGLDRPSHLPAEDGVRIDEVAEDQLWT
jgi:hypothetical protein